MISLALEGEGNHKAYRMAILRNGNFIWKGTGLKPDSHNSLSVGFNSTFFREGDYLLRVEGVAEDNSTRVVGEYSIRVLKTP